MYFDLHYPNGYVATVTCEGKAVEGATFTRVDATNYMTLEFTEASNVDRKIVQVMITAKAS